MGIAGLKALVDFRLKPVLRPDCNPCRNCTAKTDRKGVTVRLAQDWHAAGTLRLPSSHPIFRFRQSIGTKYGDDA